MTLQEWSRLVVIIFTTVLAVGVLIQVFIWDRADNEFNLRDLFTALGKDKKQHPSRAALAEIVALFATTSAYLGTLAVKPEMYELSTLVYGGLWVVRGGYSTYLRSKTK